MKILVTVKRVPDPEPTIKVKPDGTGIVTDNVKWVVNPFDEIAIEEALRIKEKVGGAEVVLVEHRREGRRRSSSAPGSRWAPIAPSSSSATTSSSRSAVARVLAEARRQTRSPTSS